MITILAVLAKLVLSAFLLVPIMAGAVALACFGYYISREEMDDGFGEYAARRIEEQWSLRADAALGALAALGLAWLWS